MAAALFTFATAGCSASGDDSACRRAADAANSGFTTAMSNWKWFSYNGSQSLLLVSDSEDQYQKVTAVERGKYADFLAAYAECSGQPAPGLPSVEGRTPPP